MTKSPAILRRNPILVTGAHRTGTTWVGKMLAASREVAYISEPLNTLHRPGVMRAPTEHWYTYITNQNEAQYLPAFQETLAFRYHTLAEIKSLRSKKDFMRMLRDRTSFLLGRLGKQRPLLKDPFAVFSAPWFADKLNCQVVITVRHPAAFASSLKRLGWQFDFNDLIKQPLLMQDWLEPYRDKMDAILRDPDDVIGQSSLLWCMIYQTVKIHRESYPHFKVIRHEDLSVTPIDGYRDLYSSLGLNFTPRAEWTIQNSSNPENPKELSHKAVHAVRLDSRANLLNWKNRLAPEEISRIRQLTEDIAFDYYPDIRWD